MTEVDVTGMPAGHPATPTAHLVPEIHSAGDGGLILTSTVAHATHNASYVAEQESFFAGFITLLLLVLIGIAVLVLTAKTMRKGSYRTNEKGNDEESNAALQAEG